MIEINLPWPAKELSPNERLHWAKEAKVKKAYRTECFYLAFQFAGLFSGTSKLKLEITFYRPTRRSYDLDNLLARMKSGIDGVADGLNINDKRFDPVIVSVAEDLGNYVKLRIFNNDNEETKK